jgi:hypothetical protein
LQGINNFSVRRVIHDFALPCYRAFTCNNRDTSQQNLSKFSSRLSHITIMDENTRKLILRIQSEDLADLWTTSTYDNSEIDATLRVYRRQLKVLDRHLENARQERAREGTGEGAGHDAVTTAPPILDIEAPVLVEDGDVRRVEVDYSRLESPILQAGGVHLRPRPSFLKTPVVSTVPTYNGTSTRSHQVSDRPVVRLPPPRSTTARQVDKPTRAKHEAASRDQKAEEAHEEAVRKEETIKKMNSSRPPPRKLLQRQPSLPHSQSAEEMSIDDIFNVQDQKKVERMMTVAPGLTINVLYEALQICHGSFDDAVDMIFRQEGDDVDMDDSDLSNAPAVQLDSSAEKLIKGPTRAVADDFSTTSKPSDTTLLAAVDRRSSMSSTEPSTTKTRGLKRSADHFIPSDNSPSKKHTSVLSKKESEHQPAQPVTKGTIGDQVDDLLQSARLLPSPTPRAGNIESRHDDRDVAPNPPPPSHRQNLDTRSNGQHSGPPRDSRSVPPPPSTPPSGPRYFQDATRGRRRR